MRLHPVSKGAAKPPPTQAPALPPPERDRTHAPPSSLAALNRPVAQTSTGCACGGGCPACGSASRQRTPRGPAAQLLQSASARLGTPLQDVQLTTDGPLADRARARGADAAASSNVIAFPGGLPNLTQPTGRFALGHELGHVADARKGRPTGQASEDRADQAGREISGKATPSGASQTDHPAPETLAGEPVQFGIFDPLLDFFDDPAGYATAAAPNLSIAAMRILAQLPTNYVRYLTEVVDTSDALSGWIGQTATLLVNWPGQQVFIDHLIDGVAEGAFIAGELLAAAIDVIGVNEVAHALFETSGALRPLSGSEIAASRHVHPPGLIPYALIRVDDDGIVARLAALSGGGVSVYNQIFGTKGVHHRAVTTMHVIHTGGPMSDDLAAHELTHVAQYEMAGGAYMAQALHAQLRGDGYDYDALDGSLVASIAAGRSFADFNREQQGQICQDYYLARFGGTPIMGGALPELEHFVRSLWSIRGVSWPVGGP